MLYVSKDPEIFWSGNCVWNVTNEVIHGIKLPPPVKLASSYFDLQKNVSFMNTSITPPISINKM